MDIDIQALMALASFKPNPSQKQAILETENPLFLVAGPGSGKTKVLLWRTLNLIVFHHVKPEEIFLSTFTEKAAFQLREGLRSLLGLVTNETGISYDIARMYIGTVHSLCMEILTDRRFALNGNRVTAPTLLDGLGQYFYLADTEHWQSLTEQICWLDDANSVINEFFDKKHKPSLSKYKAVNNCIQLFNRLSEECINPDQVETKDPVFAALMRLYAGYREILDGTSRSSQTDFALLQQKALARLQHAPNAGQVFKHIIIDEYQDTNFIQEQLYFSLAAGYKNICVVGDDDQALYRFRGSTVESFVEFPDRCRKYLGQTPKEIPLNINYRSRKGIVDFYKSFMQHCDWKKQPPLTGAYRITTKDIQANSKDSATSVVASTPGKPDDVAEEIADLVKRLLDEKKVADPKQIAFLFPSLQYEGKINSQVRRMKEALEARGLKVYAPRAGRFLETEEATVVLGVFLLIFGKPTLGEFISGDLISFHDWMDHCMAVGRRLCEQDGKLQQYVSDTLNEIKRVETDYALLLSAAAENGWELEQTYQPEQMQSPLQSVVGLSNEAQKSIRHPFLINLIEERAEDGNPVSLSYVINRATALHWGVLDLFYRLCGFSYFRAMFQLAENGKDEGPICNLSLLTSYLSRFMDKYSPLIAASFLFEGRFQQVFFGSYLYTLFRMGESEFENDDDPFPRGRIPFLTVHQSKGLEFPVVILGNPRKDDRGPQFVETLIRPLLHREGEPLGRASEFDIMRMFYVALSRAQNLMVIAHFTGQGNHINEPFKQMLDKQFPRIPQLDLDTFAEAKLDSMDITKAYSFTSDYLVYQRCQRQYMIFRKYGFVPSRSGMMVFGSLVHKTIEDLHYRLIANADSEDDAAVEKFINERFNENYELLQLEGGHGLDADSRRAALQQIAMYWRKLKDIAKSVTETEVEITLPEQKTPKGRKFLIEGVVDIVREANETIMYDIKTHDADFVRANQELYEQQLNVYSYIWQELRQQPLTSTAVIATKLPDALEQALIENDANEIQTEIAKWNPVIDLPFDPKQVQQTIKDFGETVDRIEEKQFAPPSLDRLNSRVGKTDETFAAQVCRSCDARFSCGAYRQYACSLSRSEQLIKKYFEDAGTETQQENWVRANLEATDLTKVRG